VERNKRKQPPAKKQVKSTKVTPEQQAARDWYVNVYCHDVTLSETRIKKAEEEFIRP